MNNTILKMENFKYLYSHRLTKIVHFRILRFTNMML